jgi:hypothetical protein
MRVKIRKIRSGTYYIPSVSMKHLRHVHNTEKKLGPQQRSSMN